MRRTIFEDEHEQVRSAFRQFLEKELVPNLAAWERDGVADRELFRKAGTAGFLGMAAPEQYGGGGMHDFRFNLVIGEEVQAVGAGGAGLGITLHNDICLPYFLSLATERADHRDRDDRAGHRLRPRVDVDDRDPRR
jgi:alkylation response protein AidB-like acyl-CoA dehydrogenase